MRNYVIIGGSSGIGKELVNVLKKEEASIYATFNQNEIGDSENIKYQKLNVLDTDLNFNDLPDEIHGLAYCPGSINLKPFARIKKEEFLEDFQLQVLGAINVIQQLLPRLKQSGDASIVLFSTIAVQLGFNFHSQVSVSKGAIEGLTKSLAAEFAPSIRVNAIAPSLTNTPLASKFLNSPEKITAQVQNNPMKRIGEAKDIAEMAAFLLSEKTSWITGQILHVDGGYSSVK
jgi:NAD(P)-dependent dehydrogenase (short-subunit alcohol dehydrogenase family)